MQILIYVGGTLVLLIFGVMLTAQGPFISMKTHAGEWILGAIAGGTLLAVLLQAAFSVPDWRADPELALAVAVVRDNVDAPKLVLQAKKPGDDYSGVDVLFERGNSGDVRYNAKEKTLTFGVPSDGLPPADAAMALAHSPASEYFDAWAPEQAPKDARLTPDDSAVTAFFGPSDRKTATALGLGLLGLRVDKLEQKNERLNQGMSGYLLPFEIVSVHLLVVLIGAAYLARTKRRAV
jgi:hypothetical protein